MHAESWKVRVARVQSYLADDERVTALLSRSVGLSALGIALHHSADSNGDTALLLGVSMAAFMLPRIGKLSISGNGISFEQKEDKQLISKLGIGGMRAQGDRDSTAAPNAAIEAPPPPSEDDNGVYPIPRVFFPDDPQKGRFGGKPERRGLVLSAAVRPSATDTSWFNIELSVLPMSGRSLDGAVTFYLHNTFKKEVVTVPVESGGAKLRLMAWGAFTVGALADNGDTALELDLAQLPHAPVAFRLR